MREEKKVQDVAECVVGNATLVGAKSAVLTSILFSTEEPANQGRDSISSLPYHCQ